MKLETLKNVLP